MTQRTCEQLEQESACAAELELVLLCEAELECAELDVDHCAEEQGLSERVCP